MSPIEETESVRIEEAQGRYLSREMVAPFDVPPFDRAAMDGYAVKAADTLGAGRLEPKKLRLVGEIHAGEVWDGAIGKGECLQIATGAPMPKGADAVVMVEDTEFIGGDVYVYKPVYPGANVSRRGEDMTKGDVVLSPGVLNESKIGVLAAMGIELIEVRRRPTIAIIPTGSEIVPLDQPLKPGQVYDINSYTLAGIVKANGGVPMRVGIVPDTPEAIEDAIREALGCDVVVVSGGSSVGVRDVLEDVLAKMGEIKFHGVQIKPGKPTLLGVVDNVPVLGMPGYPMSCIVNGYLFLELAVRRMANLPPRTRKRVKAKMRGRVTSTLGRRQFLTVRLRVEGKTRWAEPLFKESGAITGMALADGYVDIPDNVDFVEKGDDVVVTLLSELVPK